MASMRQPPSPHSCLLDNDRLFAEALPVWIPSYELGSTKAHSRNPDTEDFEIDWPILDKYDDEIDADVYQRPCSQGGYLKRSSSSRTYKLSRSTASPAPLTAYVLPGSRPFLNTSSKQVLPQKFSDNMGTTSKARPVPLPLVLSLSAFKVDRYTVPPAPPPTPFQTPPPTPPFCPEYEEHSTLGAFNTPAISRSPPQHYGGSTLRLPAYCPSDNETDFEDEEQDIGSAGSGCFTDAESFDDYESAPPPPPIPLMRSISQTPGTLTIPISNMPDLSKSLPATPTTEVSVTNPNASFFDWDAEPEVHNNHQWTKFKASKKGDKRRGSDSDESHASKNSVRIKAERIRKKLEHVFGKK